MQALVVSKETVPGAEAINQYRQEPEQALCPIPVSLARAVLHRSRHPQPL